MCVCVGWWCKPARSPFTAGCVVVHGVELSGAPTDHSNRIFKRHKVTAKLTTRSVLFFFWLWEVEGVWLLLLDCWLLTDVDKMRVITSGQIEIKKSVLVCVSGLQLKVVWLRNALTLALSR